MCVRRNPLRSVGRERFDTSAHRTMCFLVVLSDAPWPTHVADQPNRTNGRPHPTQATVPRRVEWESQRPKLELRRKGDGLSDPAQTQGWGAEEKAGRARTDVILCECVETIESYDGKQDPKVDSDGQYFHHSVARPTPPPCYEQVNYFATHGELPTSPKVFPLPSTQ